MRPAQQGIQTQILSIPSQHVSKIFEKFPTWLWVPLTALSNGNCRCKTTCMQRVSVLPIGKNVTCKYLKKKGKLIFLCAHRNNPCKKKRKQTENEHRLKQFSLPKSHLERGVHTSHIRNPTVLNFNSLNRGLQNVRELVRTEGHRDKGHSFTRHC